MNFDNFIFDARNVITLLSFLSFVGIVFWAYSNKRKENFDEAASLPFADDMDSVGANAREERHG